MKIALVSLDQAWEDKNANRLRCSAALEAIAALQPDMAVFPEMTLTSFTTNTTLAEAEEDAPSVLFFAEQARKHGITIIFGVMLKDAAGNCYNAQCVVDKQGTLTARYNKMHLFSLMGEDKSLVPGDEAVCVAAEGCTLGLSLCYDLRFPELFQALSKTADVIVNSACWPEKRFTAWQALLQARAIENQVFMIGVNRTGKDNQNFSYARSSLIIDPSGTLLQPEQVLGAVDVYSIDVMQTYRWREAFPMKKSRRVELYKKIL